jgi:D-amino-acid dehydrogenase
MKTRVAVIGAGITGITTAYYLARAGYKVVVYETERYPAMKTSFANGGQISVSNSEVWNSWSNIKKGIKWMFTKDAPLLIRPQLDFKQWKWILKFIRYTAMDVGKKNTAETVKMGLQSRKLYDQICADEGIEFDRNDCGIVHFYKDQSYWKNAQDMTVLYNENGLGRQTFKPSTLKMLDPALGDIKNVVGGAVTPSDWTGDIHKFCYELAEVLKTKYEVGFVFNSIVTQKYGMDTLTELFDAVVVCAGVGSVEVAKQVGDTLDIYPVKGYSITINNVDPKYLPKVSLLDDQAKIVTATLGNRFRVAGTAELAGENYDIRRDRIEPLLNWVHENFPKINTHDYTQFACLRPMTPNMMPITKQSDKNEKVFYNTGHGHLGWTLGPVTAKQVTEIVNGNLKRGTS